MVKNTEETKEELVEEPTEEQLAAEESAKNIPSDDEIRSSILEETGLEDTDANKELIEKLVAKDKSSKTALSKAIGQKRGWREKAKTKETKKTEEKPQETKPEENKEGFVTRDDLRERDIESLDVGDSLKSELKFITKNRGVSIVEAYKLPSIVALAAADKIEREAEAANLEGDGSSPTGTGGKTPKFDLSTPEGQKKWEEHKKSLK